MADTPDTWRDDARTHRDAPMNAADLEAWFVDEVLPLEAILMQYLRNHWRDPSEIDDLRQEVYVRVYEAALERIPDRPKQFVFATARNLLIDRVRQGNVVPIEAASDLEALEVAADAPGPEHIAIARDDLRHLQSAIDRLPPRAREVILLRYYENLTYDEMAQWLGVARATVNERLAKARALLRIRLAKLRSDV